MKLWEKPAEIKFTFTALLKITSRNKICFHCLTGTGSRVWDGSIRETCWILSIQLEREERKGGRRREGLILKHCTALADGGAGDWIGGHRTAGMNARCINMMLCAGFHLLIARVYALYILACQRYLKQQTNHFTLSQGMLCCLLADFAEDQEEQEGREAKGGVYSRFRFNSHWHCAASLLSVTCFCCCFYCCCCCSPSTPGMSFKALQVDFVTNGFSVPREDRFVFIKRLFGGLAVVHLVKLLMSSTHKVWTRTQVQAPIVPSTGCMFRKW